MLDNKSILLTGGTGSFGQAFTRIVLSKYNPRVIRILSRHEDLQRQMQQKFKDDRLRFLIGDVRDKERVRRAMTDVDIVIHAAALKQVPVCEYCPDEAVKTNVDGTMNVIDSALDVEVEKMIAISSDKCAQPTNLYGATKLVMEKLVVQANTYVGKRKTRFACVRYGNVIGSTGSVIPLFQEQKKLGELTITDKDMTRFWITLEQGVQFVIDNLNRMKGGEVFIPKIPSMKIIDIAKTIAPQSNIKIIGIRQGEKLHETLITEDESGHTREYGTYYAIIPETIFWDEVSWDDGIKCSLKKYTSDGNNNWLSIENFSKLIEGS